MRSIGLDLGAKKISFCAVENGKVVMRRTVRSLTDLDDVLGPNTPKATIAIEACREAWHVHDELGRRGHDVLLVDTTRVRKLGIGQHGRKTDRIDAEVLARAVESGHIPRAHVLSPQRRELRAHLLVRRALIESRTQYVSTLRGVLRAHGVKLASCEPESIVVHFRRLELDPALHALCSPLIEVLISLEPQIALIDRKIDELAKREPITQLLMTAPGVGVVVASMFISVIDEAKRFKKPHQVQSYLGLVPSENSSGGPDKRRLGAISKQGNPYLRSLLVQAAWSILRMRDESDPLRIWADALVARAGKKRAVIALARRLAGVLWAMWRDGTVYDPSVIGKASATGTHALAQSTELRAKSLKRATAKAKRFVSHPSSLAEGNC